MPDNIIWGPSSCLYLLFIHVWGGRGGVHGPQGSAGGRHAFLLQGDDKDLDRLLHQLLPVVWEQQVVVGEAEAHGVVGADHVEQRGEQRKDMSAKDGRRSDRAAFTLRYSKSDLKKQNMVDYHSQQS